MGAFRESPHKAELKDSGVTRLLLASNPVMVRTTMMDHASVCPNMHARSWRRAHTTSCTAARAGGTPCSNSVKSKLAELLGYAALAVGMFVKKLAMGVAVGVRVLLLLKDGFGALVVGVRVGSSGVKEGVFVLEGVAIEDPVDEDVRVGVGELVRVFELLAV